jgi:hypothetical protein
MFHRRGHETTKANMPLIRLETYSNVAILVRSAAQRTLSNGRNLAFKIRCKYIEFGPEYCFHKVAGSPRNQPSPCHTIRFGHTVENKDSWI